MKKLTLLLVLLVTFKIGSAQLILTGNSYTQDFNSLATLPTGWHIFTGATTSSLGNDMAATKYFPGKNHTWEKYFGEFREVASANASIVFQGFDSVAQSMATDRALAVRQVGPMSTSFPGSDSGAAFALRIDNPEWLTAFQLSFKLQSLDSTSPRETTWTVDYGIGVNPTSFTPLTITGDNTTGGNTYSNETININFGTALDNIQNGPLWIRIVTLHPTTGSGNRTTTAIDDFNLTWTGNVGVKDDYVTNTQLTAYATTSSALVSFNAPQPGNYELAIVDLTGRIVHAGKLSVKQGTQKHHISNLSILPGVYIVKLLSDRTIGTTKVIVQ